MIHIQIQRPEINKTRPFSPKNGSYGRTLGTIQQLFGQLWQHVTTPPRIRAPWQNITPSHVIKRRSTGGNENKPKHNTALSPPRRTNTNQEKTN